MPRRLLLISYLFPPYGGVAVQRALSFAKYLPANGVEVHVLTASNAAAPVRDPGLLRHVPPQVAVHHALTLEPPFYLRKKVWNLLDRGGKAASPAPAENNGSGGGLRALVKSVLMPDPQVLWKPLALRAASRIIRQHNIDTVLVTAPPFSVFLIGNELKRRHPHIRLVSDFRDEWLRFYLTDFDFLSDSKTRLRAQAIERETIEQSDLVVAVTRGSLNEISSRYPAQPASKFALLANGYDPEEFQQVERRWHGNQGRIVVTYVGTAYKTASPSYYLDAVDALPDEIRSRIETRFIGRVVDTERHTFENRKSRIQLLGFLPHAEAIRHTAETDYLLLTITHDFMLPGKLFEYLATGKPVLALSPKGGEVDRLLAETRGGVCAAHDDPAAIRAMLLDACRRIDGGPVDLQPDWEAIRSYERPRLARSLARLLNERLP